MQASQPLPMSHDITIKEGALFIADAHDSDERSFFLNFLEHLQHTPPPQLFLMGDMFDLLVGGISHTEKKYARYIEAINALSKTCEIIYFEGNHDFNLSKLFLHVNVIPIQHQPMRGCFEDGTICLLSHGDRYAKGLEALYTAWIRHPLTLTILGAFNVLLGGAISRAIMRDQRRKNLCRTIPNFEALIASKIDAYPRDGVDMIVEGHYHQNQFFTCKNIRYVNFPSFACNQSYFSVQSSQETKFVSIHCTSCPKK